MAYDSNYLAMISVDAGKNGVRLYSYRTLDAKATIEAAGYISDATDHGMREGDAILVQSFVTTIGVGAHESQWYQVTDVTAAGAAEIDTMIDIT